LRPFDPAGRGRPARRTGAKARVLRPHVAAPSAVSRIGNDVQPASFVNAAPATLQVIPSYPETIAADAKVYVHVAEI